ncbi:hypothetical protein [Amycolatopsis sp. CA-230715]|uniref:hypothetical protein n=1 Tax=Amycolatopsis sp. CA-230715 TaxID=2745196 RepID=UPI001C023A34|nr:hypothetical protein [Amycolatopsis sp. CA-230715]
MTDERPLRLLHEIFTSGQQVEGSRGPYEVAAKRLIETEPEHRLEVEVVWAEPKLRVEVAALLVMRHSPGEERVRWLLAAAATRPWRPQFEPPAERVGLTAFADVFDRGGLNIDARRLNHLDGRAQREQIAALLTQGITAPERSASLLVLNQAAVVCDVRGWSGLLQVVSIDEGLRQVINARIPLAHQLPTGYRLFTAPCDGQPDTIVASRTTAIKLQDVPRETMLAPLLLWRRAAELPAMWRDDPIVTEWWRREDPFVTETTHAQLEASEAERLRRELAATRRSLDIEQRAHAELQRRCAADAEKLRELRARVVELSHGADLATENTQLHEMMARYAAALEDTEDELDDALRKITDMLADVSPRVSTGIVGHEPVREFATFPDLLDAARTTFPHLVFTAADAPAATLDEDEKAGAWRRKAWAALSTLNAYAVARHTGGSTKTGPATLREFIRSGQPGALIGLHALKLSESEAVIANDRLRSARVFRVPEEVDPSGYGFFGAHIALEKFKPPAPRLHFLDDTGHSGVLCVGYLGPHLPNTKTN